MADVRFGVVGAGRIAQVAHLPALERAEGARLVGICDPSPVLSRGVARRYDVPGYDTLDQLLGAGDVDAVIVAVPDRLHLPLAAQALRAGAHVLVEKPLAPTVSEAEELAALADASGLHLQVGAMKRHDPGVQHAALAVRERIGPVLTASLWYRVMSALRPATEATLFPHLVVDESVRSREATFKADRSAYLLTTHGAHVLDGLRLLLGDVLAVSARHAVSGPDHTWHVGAELASGGLAHVEITASVHGEWSEGAEIYGQRGSVRLRTHFPFTRQASDVEVFEEGRSVAERSVFADSDAYERQVEAFARSIRDGTPCTPDAADGVAAVRLIEAVGRSVADGGSWRPV
jgi:predicted dehydrogenase